MYFMSKGQCLLLLVRTRSAYHARHKLHATCASVVTEDLPMSNPDNIHMSMCWCEVEETLAVQSEK